MNIPLWQPILSEKGILTGTDASTEWLLPWWLKQVRKKNHLPIAFIDFGMTASAKEWCQNYGSLLTLPWEVNPGSKEKVDPYKARIWETLYSPKELWNARKAWFKKPLGFLQTPFQWTLWLDLDCEVLDSLNPLFEDPTTQLAMVKEPSSSLEAQYKLNLLTPGTLVYNSGVLFYPHGYPLLTHLAQVAESQSKFFMGDQDLLANLLHAKPNCVKELSNIYNWRIAEGFNPEAIIIHWVGVFGKNQLKMRLRS